MLTSATAAQRTSHCLESNRTCDENSFNTFRHEDTSPTVDLLDHTLARSYPFLVSSVTMPRDVFLQCGLFDTDLRRGEDTRYWFRLALTQPKIIGIAGRLEWGRPPADLKSRSAQLETLRSTILNLASGMPLDSLSELLLSEALREASYDPSFTNAATDVLSEVHGGSPYAGLRDALRRLQVSPKSAVVPSVTQLHQTST